MKIIRFSCSVIFNMFFFVHTLFLKRMTDLALYCVAQDTGNRSCSIIFNMLFCTHIVFVIIFSNLKLIIFEDQGKYWHVLLLSTLI